MNSNEIIWQVLRSGFPIFVLVVYGMILYRTWTNKEYTSAKIWKWTAIVVIPGLIGLACLFAMFQVGTDNVQLYNILTILTLFLPFTGVFAWLVGTR